MFTFIFWALELIGIQEEMDNLKTIKGYIFFIWDRKFAFQYVNCQQTVLVHIILD